MDRLVTSSSAKQCLKLMKCRLPNGTCLLRNGTFHGSTLVSGGQSNVRRITNLAVNKCGLRYSQVKLLKKELRAVRQILENSNLQPSNLTPLLSCHQQRWYSNEKQNSSNDEEGAKGMPSPGDPEKMQQAYLVYAALGLLVIASIVAQRGMQTGKPIYISWMDFQNDLLAKGMVERIRIYVRRDGTELVRVKLLPGSRYRGNMASAQILVESPQKGSFESRLSEFESDFGISANDRIPVEYIKDDLPRVLITSLWIVLAVCVVVQAVMWSRKKGSLSNSMQEVMMSPFKMNVRRGDVAAGVNKIKFKDVAGLTEAKVELLEFVDYIKKPQRFKDLGAKVPKGALLLGPPGCGKTLLAKALASEAEVPFFAMAGSEFIEMIGGLGASRVRDLFKQARSKTPCIVYIDEIDTIGQQRGGGGGSEMGLSRESEQTLNQLLTEMDGMGTKEGVVILASTNRAEVLDKALLRPGRFDRHILIDFPTLKERVELFELYLSKLKLSEPMSAYAPRLAQLTPGMSGADIANVCNEAAIHAARSSQKVVGAKDFEYATERVIAGVAKTTSTMTPAEKKVVAYHESGHALAGWLMEHTDALLKISIVPRTSATLGFAQYLPSDYKLYNTEQLFDRMCMALAGRAAESIIFNKITNGAEDDLKKVTKMAYAQVKTYGMNPMIGQLSFPTEEETGTMFGKKPYSKQLANLIDQEAQQLVARAYKHVEQLLMDNKEKLHKLATSLLEKETMNYADVEGVIGPPRYSKKKTIDVLQYLQDFDRTEK